MKKKKTEKKKFTQDCLQQCYFTVRWLWTKPDRFKRRQPEVQLLTHSSVNPGWSPYFLVRLSLPFHSQYCFVQISQTKRSVRLICYFYFQLFHSTHFNIIPFKSQWKTLSEKKLIKKKSIQLQVQFFVCFVLMMITICRAQILYII